MVIAARGWDAPPEAVLYVPFEAALYALPEAVVSIHIFAGAQDAAAWFTLKAAVVSTWIVVGAQDAAAAFFHLQVQSAVRPGL